MRSRLKTRDKQLFSASCLFQFPFLQVLFSILFNLNLVVSALDDHVFHLQKAGSSPATCITIETDPHCGSLICKDDVFCEASFDTQKFLYSKAEQKIKSLSLRVEKMLACIKFFEAYA